MVTLWVNLLSAICTSDERHLFNPGVSLMSLTRRQKNIVDQILKEEMASSIQARRDGERLLDRSLLNEEYELDEAGIDVERIDNSVMKSALEEPVIDLANDAAHDAFSAFDKRLMFVIQKVINKHGMFPEKVSRIGDDLEDAFGDELMLNQQELVSDIVEAFEKYALKVGEMAVSLVTGGFDD